MTSMNINEVYKYININFIYVEFLILIRMYRIYLFIVARGIDYMLRRPENVRRFNQMLYRQE